MTPIEKLRRIADMTALEGVADAIREVADEMDWRPIETAPKDGRSIVVGYARQSGFPMKIVRFDNVHHLWKSYGLWEPGLEANATHWMLLPPAPAAKAGAK